MSDRPGSGALFLEALRRRPLGVGLGLVAEYAMFASAVPLALTLYATRRPLAFVDRHLPFSVRALFEDALARISPG